MLYKTFNVLVYWCVKSTWHFSLWSNKSRRKLQAIWFP